MKNNILNLNISESGGKLDRYYGNKNNMARGEIQKRIYHVVKCRFTYLYAKKMEVHSFYWFMKTLHLYSIIAEVRHASINNVMSIFERFFLNISYIFI